MAAPSGNFAGYQAQLFQHTAIVAHSSAAIATVAVAGNLIGGCRQVPVAGNQQDTANIPIAGQKFIAAIPTTISDNTSTFSITVDFSNIKATGLITDPGTTPVTWMIVYGIPGNANRYTAQFDAYVAGINVTSELSDVIQAEVKLARTTQFDFFATP